MDSIDTRLVNTTEILPTLHLRPYIRYFAYREWDVTKLARPLFASNDFLITFNLSEKKFGFIEPIIRDLARPEKQMNSALVITGVGSQFAGFMTSDGEARIFSIYFSPTGFYRIFGIPGVLFADRIEEDAMHCDRELSILHDRLRGSKNVLEMTAHCESFVILRLKNSRASDPYNSIQSVSELFLSAVNNHSIEKVARDVNMSLRTFERRFKDQVGVSPKLFSRIARFNRAISLRMQYPQKSWTKIAHACGYFDQMHFIKDFKQFSGKAPGPFFEDSPPLEENFIKGFDQAE